jgi:hypothetical protein
MTPDISVTSRKKATFAQAMAALHRFGDEIRRRFPAVEVSVWQPHVTSCSLGVSPIHFVNHRVEVVGIVDLGDVGVAMGGVRVRTLGAMQGFLDRNWAVASFTELLVEMQETGTRPAEGRVFRGLANAVGEPLPFAFEISPTDVTRFAASPGEANLAGVEVVLCPRGNPNEASASILPGDRAIFAGHWIKVLDATLTAPGRWTLDCVKTLDPRVRRVA